MRGADRHIRRALGDEWGTRAQAPSLLDIGRAGDGLGPDLRAAGLSALRPPGERPAPATGMRSEFTGTGERWMAGSRQLW